jgi:glycosyltransferase involved in cell wall biosynthesis
MAWTVIIGLMALVWVVQVVRLYFGMRSLPRLEEAAPLADADCPAVSVLFAARDEEEKLPRALRTKLALDYPRYEVIAVDDRSRDSTGRILDDAAAGDARLKVVHVTKLPADWLGKTHALQRAYERSSGEWLVFTDADVRFTPDVLRRSLAVARQQGWDHLTIFGRVDTASFWERVLCGCFFFGGTLMLELWRVSNPRSLRFAGAGMFQLVSRSAYQASGTHQRLALEVVDDMKLGKIVKRSGFRSGVVATSNHVAVRWHDGGGARGVIRNLEKNMFAAAYFNVGLTLALQVLLLVLLTPAVALFFLPIASWTWVLAAVATLMPALGQGAACAAQGIPAGYGLTWPLGFVLFGYGVANSAWKTLRQGGIYWRGTFHSLEKLRKGMV